MPTDPHPDPALPKPDLRAFAAAVRFRDSAVAAAVAHHERAGLRPSSHYARATFDAIEAMIREDERRALAAAGRLLPELKDIRTEWGVWWHSRDSDGIVLTADKLGSRERAERIAKSRIGDYGITRYTLRQREHRSYADGSVWSGPWLPADPYAPTTTKETTP